MEMSDVKEFQPQWTKRRRLVFFIIFFFALLVAVNTGIVVWLSLALKFSIWPAAFLITNQVLAVTTVIATFGSYVFGSKWENDSFFNLIKDITPKIGSDGKE